MNRKIKLAALALLGFSTACSSVKKAPKDGGKVPVEQTTIVMYGVRMPEPEPEIECNEMKKTPAPEIEVEVKNIEKK